ncbi:MAG: hypothetical protein K5666_00265 [Bacilli bacterium]|nr:hypothetical protein [Bacilli bacterium]
MAIALVDFKAMKSDKELFDSMADRLIKDTLTKKKYYATLYNKANMLKNEINKLLIDLNALCFENGIAINKSIHEFTYSELEDLLVDSKVDNKINEKIKIFIYKIKMRLDEIKELRIKMIQLDLYEGHLEGMEDDTLDEEYIDMDRIRAERGIDLNNEYSTEEAELDLSDEVDSPYYTCRLDGYKSLKQIAYDVYGNPSYWIHIYNYDDNSNKINKVILDNNISIKDIISNPSYLEGIKIKIPKEIEFYSDEFNTAVLERVA